MSAARAKPGLTLGPVLMLIASYFFWQMGNVAATGTSPRDPGPRFWPTTLAICLMAAGLITTVHALVVRLRPTKPAEKTPPPKSLKQWLQDWGVQNVALLLAALPAYVLAIPWLGYAVSTWLLSTLVMARLGEPGVSAVLERRREDAAIPVPAWKTWLITVALAALISLALVALIILLFDRVFRLPLPHGELLNLPF